MLEFFRPQLSLLILLFTSKDLWHKVKPLVGQFKNDSRCLIFDDSLIEKAYTDEIIGWYFDPSENHNKKGAIF